MTPARAALQSSTRGPIMKTKVQILRKSAPFWLHASIAQKMKISKIDFMYLFLFIMGFNIIIFIKLRAQGPKRAQKGPHIIYYIILIFL